jgi:para-nitrobenzyl esterase
LGNIEDMSHSVRLPRTIVRGVALAAVLCASFTGTPAAGADSPIVKTLDGPVRGASRDGVREFLGIPYAAPPVGTLRWRPPEPHAVWNAALDATRFGASCPQRQSAARSYAMSEDCLFLNIFTPDPPGARLPVMVWIHGGAFVLGSGASYDGSALSAKHKMVVVSINYRLGALGFLASRDLDAESAERVSGNYGLLDQQAALKWVKRNIAAFSGDPNNVTIAGESAGGISVRMQLASPQASGLFARAIIESGPCLHERTLAEAEVRSDELAAKLGCDKEQDKAACMRSKPADQVASAIPASGTGPLIWAPVVDGRVIPKKPADAFRAGTFNRVPVINGSNRDEGTLFIAFGRAVTKDNYAAAIGAFAPQSLAPSKASNNSNASKAIAEYPLDHYASPAEGLAAVFGDAIFSCPIEKAGELLSAYVPVYQYEFNDRDAPVMFMAHPPFPLGAYHASEIPYVFQTDFPTGRKSASGFSPAQQKLSDEIAGYWSGFIASGDPGASSRKWEPKKAGDPRILSLAPDGIRYESDFDKSHHCALWNSLRQ